MGTIRRLANAGVAIMCLLACGAALAQQATGRVRGLYAESAPGVLTDRTFLAPGASARRWADVELQSPETGASRSVLAEVPKDAAMRIGDWVSVRLAATRSMMLGVAALPRVARITDVHQPVLAGLPLPPRIAEASEVPAR